MKTTSPHLSSERGIALVVVMLLMAVLSALATGFAMTGQTEAQMSNNEVYYAGARAAAEAGMNRAIVNVLSDTTHNLLAGPDGTIDSSNPSASTNADNGSLSYLLGTGPFTVDANNEYSYNVSVVDDDDASLYQTALTSDQLAQMGEDGNNLSNTNDRLILKVVGYGPKGTTVTLQRILETVDSTQITTTTTTSLSNPALLVNGDLVANGNINILGSSGSMHTNGNLTLSGNSATVSQDATAHGTFTANQNWHAGGSQGGGRPTVNVPDVHAIDYVSIADYKLTTVGGVGVVQTYSGGTWSTCTTAACKSTGWSYNSATGWSISGNSAGTGTYYVEGTATVSGNPNGGGSGKNATNLALSIIATGDIKITGTPKFTPENAQKIQFVTDKDLIISGNTDLDDTTNVEGQIMVREQMSISGNPEFQGRIIVQDATSTSNTVTTNTISGNPTITYNGTLGAISTTTTTTTTGSTTYVNNVHGWIEQ
jgi:Tfp pilus assembly protein PilX